MKTIPEFSNYMISKTGQIWSCRRKKFLKLCSNNNGYLLVVLCKNKKHYTRFVHRLVLKTYVGPCPTGMEACHNNGDPANNWLKNLRWDNRENNMLDIVKHGTRKGSKNNMAKLTEKDIKVIIYMWRTGLFLQKEIAKIYKVAKSNINGIINKRFWKHIWLHAT